PISKEKANQKKSRTSVRSRHGTAGRSDIRRSIPYLYSAVITARRQRLAIRIPPALSRADDHLTTPLASWRQGQPSSDIPRSKWQGRKYENVFRFCHLRPPG